MDRLKMHSFDVIGSNIKKIQQLFPNCVTERLGKDGKPELAIDFEKLQAEFSNEIIGEGEERYQFTWPDKRAANRLANTPTTMTLRPLREESVNFDHTQNLYIEGDNLDVLKALRETYLGKVKMIYIAPPTTPAMILSITMILPKTLTSLKRQADYSMKRATRPSIRYNEIPRATDASIPTSSI